MGDDRLVDVCTLGMFIIALKPFLGADEIHFLPPKAPAMNIIGGAGSYAAIGARLFSPPPSSESVGWIVDEGCDFPLEIRQTIRSWNTSCLLRRSAERVTTKAWNGYGVDQQRAFKYLTPKLLLDEHALTPRLLMSRSFHLICSPERCIDLVQRIIARRREATHNQQKQQLHAPLFVWEPVPTSCLPSELENCIKALKYVDVVSPNHHELGSLFGDDPRGDKDSGVAKLQVDKWVAELFERTVESHGHKVSVVIRAGREGCYLRSQEGSSWLPAYHQPTEDGADQPEVVDPTGGGNAFLGCLSMALAQGMTLKEAAEKASVAASFVIEQVGMPILSKDSRGETWNGICVIDRLASYKSRLEQ